MMIPGAWESRDRRPDVRPAHHTDLPVTRHADSSAVFDRERLEREREGGGAPRERAGARPPTIFARIWRRLLHPSQIPLTGATRGERLQPDELLAVPSTGRSVRGS